MPWLPVTDVRLALVLAIVLAGGCWFYPAPVLVLALAASVTASGKSSMSTPSLLILELN